MLLAALVTLAGTLATAPADDWKSLAPGIDIKWVTAKERATVGNSRFTVVRMDPAAYQLVLLGQSNTGEHATRTARDWARAFDLIIAINAGMFASDFTTHLGLMESGGHVFSSKAKGYQSVAAFGPKNPETDPPFRIFDLDEPGITIQGIRQGYASLVQNLRLIKRPRRNRWREQNKRWSEAALGEDKNGRVLFIFSRSPFSMHDLNRELITADIGLVAAQHLEGGPEAQLYLNVGGVEYEMFGSYETAFNENDDNAKAWPIPNVLGVRSPAANHASEPTHSRVTPVAGR